MRAAGALLMAAGGLLAESIHAEVLDTLQELRQQGCPQSTRELPRLRRAAALDAVAREWSNGGKLTDALWRTAYRGNKAASMGAKGVTSDRDLAEILKDYCAMLTDATYSEVGVFSRAARVWIVVAAPAPLPPDSAAAQLQEQVLDRVNLARSQVRDCGTTSFGPSAPVTASALLAQAAAAHARDMAQHDHMQHEGTDGSTPSLRVARTGYRWSRVAENLAGGATNPEELVRDWLASPGHCSNIMSAEATEMGVAYATEPTSRVGIYWAQVFAKPAPAEAPQQPQRR